MNEDGSKRIEELLETLVKIGLSPVLNKELKDAKMRKLYELTGKEGVTEISKRIGFAAGKISQIWQRWEREGLIRKEGKFYKRILS